MNQSYEFCIHKAFEINPVLVELGSEGNAFDGSPSLCACSANSEPAPGMVDLLIEKGFITEEEYEKESRKN